MSIQISLCPQPHNAMNFCDMMCDSVSATGTMFGDARNESRVAVPIGGGPPASLLRSFTNWKCERIALVYAVSAMAWSLCLNAASALMNCSSAYVTTGIFDLSPKMYREGNPRPPVPV